MRRSHSGFVMIAWAALSASTARAQSLDWATCVREAQGANPNLKASKQSVVGSEAALQSSEGKYFPTISGEIDAGRSATKDDHPNEVLPDSAARAAGGGDAAQYRPENDFSFGLNVKQVLYDGKRESASVTQHEAELDSAHAAEDAAASVAAYDLKSAFARALYADQLVGIARDAATRRRANERLVQNRFDGGRENKGALLRAHATAEDADAAVIAAQRAGELARRNLGVVLGREAPVSEKIVGDLPSYEGLTANDLYKQAPVLAMKIDLARTAPAVRQANADVAAAKAAADSVRAEAMPVLAANASLTRGGADWPPDTTRLGVGLSLSIPIDVSGSTKADVRAAEASTGKSVALRDATLLDAAAALTQAATDLIDDTDRIRIQRGYADAERVQVEVARKQYELGLITFQDWQQSEDDVLNGEKTMLADRRDALIAIAALEKALGRGLNEKGP